MKAKESQNLASTNYRLRRAAGVVLDLESRVGMSSRLSLNSLRMGGEAMEARSLELGRQALQGWQVVEGGFPTYTPFIPPRSPFATLASPHQGITQLLSTSSMLTSSRNTQTYPKMIGRNRKPGPHPWEGPAAWTSFSGNPSVTISMTSLSSLLDSQFDDIIYMLLPVCSSAFTVYLVSLLSTAISRASSRLNSDVGAGETGQLGKVMVEDRDIYL